MTEYAGASNFRWLLLSFFIILLDQITKQVALSSLPPYHPVEIFSFFNLTLSFNKGAAFSIFSQSGVWAQWFLSSIAVVISVVIVIWLYRLPRGHLATSISLALILGGAIGNLSDRFFYGAVIDFLEFHYHHYYWPAFNVADSAITLGTLGLVLGIFRSGK